MDKELRDNLRQLFRSGYFLESAAAGLRALDPVEAPPKWVSEEMYDALNQIPGPHERKKRTTVLRIAEAKASGMPIRDVFGAEDTCSVSTWYGRKSPRVEIGWQDIPEVANALDVAQRRAHLYYDQLEEARLSIRRRVLANTEDRLVEISGAAVEVLFDIMLDPEAHSDVRRKAAVDALTHAAPETAPKAKSEQMIDMKLDASGPTMRDIRNRQRKLPDRVIGEEEAEPETVDVTEFAVEGVPPPPRGGLKVPGSKKLYAPPPELSSDNGNGHGEDVDDEP